MKGQSAMEYLMTYGWALLVIVIVIAVLMFIRPFGAPESCIFQSPGFSCEGHRIFGSSSGINANGMFASIVNGQQKTIKDVDIACVRGTATPPQASSVWQTIVTGANYISHGEEIGLISRASAVKCYDLTGSVPVVAPINPGEDFSGRIYLRYRFRDEPATVPQKVAVANMLGQAQ